MKRSKWKVARNSPEFNMASMIDVVFLLLIFFMCTASFSKSEDDVETTISSPSQSQQQVDLEPTRVLIQKQGDQVVILCANTKCKDVAVLYAELIKRRRIADVTVIIEGQGSVPFETMISAYDVARSAKFTTVTFSVR
jgi:biopolymer transport protein ExbD